MSLDAKPIEDAPSAIRRAFEYFEEFMDKESFKYPLLEGVKYLNPDWQIEIGFDLGSTRESMGLIGMGDKIAPRRMVRTFHISERDGTLIEMS
ncbi:hypothetical protein [Roseovarius sp. 2305UL8-3]|uniref:hypothetical protein n=1 Tax=Roseovarius conchicola TaxID=3121636 RepID=UPI003528C1E3